MQYKVIQALALLALTRAAVAAPKNTVNLGELDAAALLAGAVAGPEAEAVVVTVEAIIDVANEVVNLIKGIDQLVHQHDAEEQYTQSTTSKLGAQYPDKNVLVYGDAKSGNNLIGSVCTSHDLDIGLGFTKSYQLCVFDSGVFDRHGDGGYVNWSFEGNFKRSGSSSHVDFFPIGASVPSKKRSGAFAITYDWSSQPGSNHTHIPLHAPITYTPLVMTTPILPPTEPTCVKPVDDGTYMLHCNAANGTTALGLGYYKAVVPHGGNKGQEPDDFVLLVETTPQAAAPTGYGNITSSSASNSISVIAHDAWRFPIGAMKFADQQNNFHWNIFGNSVADTVAVDQTAGFANDGKDFFWIYKDDGKDLFTKDSWTCASLYYAM